MKRLFKRIHVRRKNRRNSNKDNKENNSNNNIIESKTSEDSNNKRNNKWSCNGDNDAIIVGSEPQPISPNTVTDTDNVLVKNPSSKASTAATTIKSNSKSRITSFVRDGDDNSDGYHRYDDDLEENDVEYEVDYRGHYVEVPKKKVKTRTSRNKNNDESKKIIRMALQASETALNHRCDAFITADAPMNDNSETSCGGLDRSGNQFFEQGKFDAALDKYKQALERKRQTLLDQSQDIIHTETDDDEEENQEEEERKRVLASMATSINNMTYLRQVQGQASPEETLQSYKMVLQIKRDILGPDHLSVGKTLNNIGSVYYLQRNFHEAAATYEQARDILDMNLGSDHLDVCTVTSNLGDVHYSMGQLKRASEEYRAALNIRWRLLGKNDPKVVRLMEQIAEVEMKLSKKKRREKSKSSKKNTSPSGDSRNSDSFEEDEFAEEIQELREDLQKDLDYFDDMAKQLPLDMIKDKVSMFHDLRELSGCQDEDQDQQEPHVSAEIVTLHDASTDDSTPPQQGSVIQVSAISANEHHSHKEDSFKSTPRLKESGDNEEHSAVAVAFPVLPASPHRNKTLSVSTAEVCSRSPVSSNGSHTLTPSERKQALASVRERLASLRSNRGGDNGIIALSAPLTNSEATTTKVQKPSAALLKTSELLTIKQGVDSLREAAATVASSSKDTAGAEKQANNNMHHGMQNPTATYFF